MGGGRGREGGKSETANLRKLKGTSKVPLLFLSGIRNFAKCKGRADEEEERGLLLFVGLGVVRQPHEESTDKVAYPDNAEKL